MQLDPIYITAARRTPMGAFLGRLANYSGTVLGEHAIRAVLESSAIEPGLIDEVLMGCVLQANLGQAPARQAALGAGVPNSVPCTTINKVCGSGMKAVIFAHDMIRAGSASLVVAGGMESMSQAPHMLAHTRKGFKLGHQSLIDHMLHDGLESPLDGRHMGTFAEELVVELGITREAQDAYAIESLTRAIKAAHNGAFDNELVEMDIGGDEFPDEVDLQKIYSLRPAFGVDGTITAANASSISDGAAALLLASAEQVNKLGLPRLARIVAHTCHAQQPAKFTSAPIGAIQKLWDKTGWKDSDVDLYEINEAFAAVVLATEGELDIDHAKVNVNGGACALGHPIGASGARIIVTLVHALRQRGLKRGVAAVCIGGGEATAIAVEIDDQ